MKIQYFDKKAKKINKEYNSVIFDIKINEYLLSKYVRIYRSNQRKNTANTKDRSEVRGGGRKPWRQTGTGRARHGSIRSPIWAGGGVTFGPTPNKNYKKKINKKEKLICFSTVLQLRQKEKSLFVIDLPIFKKTKTAAQLINSLKLDGKKVLVTNNKDHYQTMKNIADLDIKSIKDVAIYDYLKGKNLLIEKNTFKEILEKKEKQLKK